MSLTPDQKRLLAGVPNDGSSIGNVTLRNSLRWDRTRYFAVRNSLVDADVLMRGGGRGGSVRRTAIDPDPPVIYRREIELYPLMCPVIEHDWAAERGVAPIAVVQTGLQGRADTGGTWTRPDITCVAMRTFPYVPGTYLDIATFEVKRVAALDVRAVFEAVAHRRAATEAYLLVYTPFGAAEAALRDVMEVAAEHGVGVTTADDPGEFDTWDQHVPAKRFPTDPAMLDEFIRRQLPPEYKERIAARVRDERQAHGTGQSRHDLRT